MTLSRFANRARRDAFRQRASYPDIAGRYRKFREAAPVFTPATAILARARADRAAEAAGLPKWADYLHREPVTIDGPTYYVSTSPDYDTQAGDFDCYGWIERPTNDDDPPTPQWPEVRARGQRWIYNPGDSYDPASAAADLSRNGMARGLIRETLRGELLAEGWRQLDGLPFYTVIVERVMPCRSCGDDSDPGDLGDDDDAVICDACGEGRALASRAVAGTSLGGVDGLDDSLYGRLYLWDVVRDLAYEVAAEAHRTAVEARNRLMAATAHG